MAGRHYLDELLAGVRRIFADGTRQTQRPDLEFLGLDVSDDATNERTVVSAENIVSRLDDAETAIDELELSVTPSATVAAITGAEAAGAATEYSRGDHAHRLGRSTLTGSSGTMSSLALDYTVNQSAAAVGYGLHIQATETALGASHVPVRIAGSAGGEYISVARAAGVNTVAFLGSSMTLQADGLLTLASGIVFGINGEITTPALEIDDAGGINLAAGAGGGISLAQDQATSGAGQAGVVRAQRGFAGSVGGNLTIGGGLGGTSGVDHTGDTVVELGPLVGSDSASFRVRTDGTERLRVFRDISSMTTVQSPTVGLRLSAPAANFCMINISSSLDLYCGAGQQLRFGGASLNTVGLWSLIHNGASGVTWSQGITSFTDTITAKTSDAAPAPRIIEGQSALAGASTNLIGGRLELASGARATAAGGAPGEIVRRFGGGREIREYAQDDIETTDATATTAISYTLGSNRCARARASVVLRNAATGDVRAWDLFATVKDTAGTAAIVGSVTSAHDQGDAGLATAALTIDASGGAIRLRITGIAATTLSWRCVLEIVR